MELIGPLTDKHYDLGESPVWDGEQNTLYWCDVHAGQIHAFMPATSKHTAWGFDECVGSFGLTRRGRLIVALRRSLVLFDPESLETTLVSDLGLEVPHLRLNDGKVGPDGAFWIGSVHEVAFDAMRPIGALFRVTADGTVECRVDGLKASNGLAWSADGRTMFHSDSCGPWIDRWDFDPASGTMSGRLRIAEPREADGRPDGGAVDVHGDYWSAGTSAGVLNRYDPSGKVIGKIELPVPKPTMPCFGGKDMKTLYVTSRRDMLTEEERERFPLSGTVLELRSDVAGVPAFRFAD